MPSSPTPLQAEASRRNGARSRGPTTDAGKAASARNATRHGIGASVLLLEPAEQAFLADLRGALQQLHEPRNAAEMAVVHELALLEVRRRRLGAMDLPPRRPGTRRRVAEQVPLQEIATDHDSGRSRRTMRGAPDAAVWRCDGG